MNIEWNRGGSREANLVGGPKDGETWAVSEDDYQIMFFGCSFNQSEEIQYRGFTYVRDPDSFNFTYAGEKPVSDRQVSGRS